MLEECGAELAVGEQDAGRLWVIAQGCEQVEVCVADFVRHDVVAFTQFGEELARNLQRLELVGDAGGNTQVVFEDDVSAVALLHEVDAVDVDEDVLRGAEALELRVEILAGIDHVVGDDGLLSGVEVKQEGVERLESLLDARLDGAPLVDVDDTGYPVGWDGAELLWV